jgi:hypothetical protein
MRPMLAVAEVAASGPVEAITVAARSRFGDIGAARSQCAAQAIAATAIGAAIAATVSALLRSAPLAAGGLLPRRQRLRL